ncbi:TetR family transcriptional regulator [Paracoccus sp. S-4012]|uniref:TetR/AcrR family transcriptional regulator n=1 Tax=Paracoccus sp. S-4012 TaxID=2665648 RepID=UPI0012B05245|nr:TetR/AcrR family transcriptional regulator [Paracoccus sp. S-4012]MRX52192.1 TetR family transcriptional regulator [Paracoccus sp. S-4012]
MNTNPPDKSPLRADARRNRDSILRTAARHFAANGVNTSLDEIAREAGVGPGTLYRHFPSRDALLAATLTERQADILARADAAREMACSEAALTEWLRALQDYLATYDGLPAPVLTAIQEDTSVLAISCETLVALTGEFLTRAQKDGRARATITPQGLFLSALGIAWVLNRAGVGETHRRELEAIFVVGYRERGRLLDEAE